MLGWFPFRITDGTECLNHDTQDIRDNQDKDIHFAYSLYFLLIFYPGNGDLWFVWKFGRKSNNEYDTHSRGKPPWVFWNYSIR